MQQKLIFSRGIDSDTSPEAFQEGVGRYRIGVRVMNSKNGEEQAAEPVLGNTLVSADLFNGDNVVIGTEEDQLRSKNYYFVYNSNGAHTIYEYDQTSNTVSIVLTSIYFNFKRDALITGIDIIELDKDNHLLYWSDGWINPDDEDDFNEPMKVNIEKGKFYTNGDYENGYKFPLDPEIIYRIKQPPTCAPDVFWSGLEEQGGAFAASNDNASVVIAHRNPPVALQFDNPYYNPNFEYNAANGQWTVKTSGEYFISSEVVLTFLPPPPDPTGQLYGNLIILVNANRVATSQTHVSNAVFGGSHTLVVTAKVTMNAGDVVRIGGFMSGSAISGSAIFKGTYFKATENSAILNSVNRLFKKNFQFQTQFIYDDFEHSVLSSMSNFKLPNTEGNDTTGEDIVRQDNKITIRVQTGNSIVEKIRIAAKDVDSSAFSLIETLDKKELGIPDNTIYEYEFTNDILGIPLDPDESSRLMDFVPLASTSQEFMSNRIADGLITENFNPVDVDIRLPLSYGLVNTNPNSFFPAEQYLKAGQSHVVGVVYQDHGGRVGQVNATKGDFETILQNGKYGTTLNIPFLTDSRYNPSYTPTVPSTEMHYIPVVSAEFYHEPPVWAKTWKLVRSKGKSIGRYLQFAAQNLEYVDNDGNPAPPATASNLRVEIQNISGIYLKENKLSNLAYSFDKGDRIRFIAQRVGNAPSFGDIAPFLAYNDSDISSYDDLTSILNVPLDATNSVLRTLGYGVLFEIYHPVPSVADDEEFLYETEECGEVITLDDGRRAHVGELSSQGYFDFTAVADLGSFLGLIGTSPSGFSIGDKVKVAQDDGAQIAEYNTYATITGIQSLGTGEVITTDIPWKGGAPNIGGVLTKAAIINMNSGDCFRRNANMPFIVSGVTNRLYSYIETSSASNMFSSEFYDYGRRNYVDDDIKRITRPSTIRYSEKFIPGTFINGLSSVGGLSFEEYDQANGGIYKLFYINQTLKMFQELKIGSIPVDQILYTDAEGNQVLGTSETVLSKQVIYYKDELGIGKHPESFAWYKGAGYGIDVKNGIHWRLANDGLTAISEVYNMDTFYTRKCADILSSPDRVRILGAFDVDYGEYVVAFDEYTNRAGEVVPAETLAFNEGAKEWSTFHFYKPEMLSASGVGLISFKDGKLYTHDTNPIYNNFYGVTYKPQLWFYCNIGPSKKKVFEAISLECKDSWDVVIETPVTEQNPNGQHTEMIDANFVTKEGFPYSDILKDDYTPNTVAGAPYLPDARFTGNPMRGVYALVKLEFQKSTYTKIWACNILVIASERSDK